MERLLSSCPLAQKIRTGRGGSRVRPRFLPNWPLPRRGGGLSEQFFPSGIYELIRYRVASNHCVAPAHTTRSSPRWRWLAFLSVRHDDTISAMMVLFRRMKSLNVKGTEATKKVADASGVIKFVALRPSLKQSFVPIDKSQKNDFHYSD